MTIRINKEFIDKKQEIPKYSVTEKLYHIINVTYDNEKNELNIQKKINYLYGHGHEKLDKIYCYEYSYSSCYKTQNLQYLNENEDKIIQELINIIYSEFNRKIKKNRKDIVDIEKRIKIEEENKKNFNEFFREQKLKRIINVRN